MITKNGGLTHEESSFFVLAVIGIIYLQTGTVLALTISASASGSATPPVVVNPNHFLSVTSGSFTYTGWSSVGDGNDEDVDWVMDFTGDPNYAAFVSAHSLGSARFIMTFIPQNYLVNEDIVGFRDGSRWIEAPEIRNAPVGVASTIQLDLLRFYSASEILRLLSDGSGIMAMHYADASSIRGTEAGK